MMDGERIEMLDASGNFLGVLRDPVELQLPIEAAEEAALVGLATPQQWSLEFQVTKGLYRILLGPLRKRDRKMIERGDRRRAKQARAAFRDGQRRAQGIR